MKADMVRIMKERPDGFNPARSVIFQALCLPALWVKLMTAMACRIFIRHTQLTL